MKKRVVIYILKGGLLKNSVIAFILTAFFVLFISDNIVHPNPYIWLFLIGGAICIFILKNHEAGLILMFISLFLLNWLSEAVGIIPRQITWLPEVILIILVFKTLFTAVTEKKLPTSIISTPVLFLFILGIISSFINSSGVIVTFAGFRNYFKFFLFFYVIAFLNFDDAFLRKVVKFLIVIAFCQIPVAILQRFLHIGNPSGDPVGGTLGGHTSGTLTLYLLGIVSVLIALFINKMIRGRTLLFSMILLFIPMVINETKITFYLFPVLILFLLRKNLLKGQSLKPILALAVLSGLIFIGSYFSYDYIFNKIYRRNIKPLDFDYTANYFSKEYRESRALSRISLVKFANRNITRDMNTTLLGVGPGNASDSFFVNGVGYYFNKYKTLKIDSVFLGRFIWEYGYLGLAIFLFILFRLFRLAERIYNNSPDPFYKSLGLGFEGMMFILVVATIYSSSFIIDSLGYIFWFMAGYLHRIQSIPKD